MLILLLIFYVEMVEQLQPFERIAEESPKDETGWLLQSED